MLERIATGRLRVGMYIAGVESSWLRSPFWRSRFLLTDPDDIAELRAAGISEVVIDTTKGIGTQPEPGAPDGPAVPLLVERRVRRRGPFRREADRARATVEKSKEAVRALFGEARLGHAVDVAGVAPLVDEIAASMARDRSALLNVTRLKTKDEYTYLHSVAVCALMMTLGRELGLDDTEVRHVGLAGLLHDIGKMGVPEAVLAKPGRLDDDEFALIRGHPEKGHAMLVDSADVSAIALDVCLHHHEKVDGTGYPFGLSGDRLSLHARMGAICDVYDAVTSERPYKAPWSANEALARMLEWEGHFDPQLLQAFVRSLGIPPRDALVRLHSNRLGIVAHGGGDPAAPVVRAFYDVPGDRFLPPDDVATANRSGGDPIIRLERWSYWFGERAPTVLAAIKGGDLQECAALPPRTEPIAVAGAAR